MRSGSYRHPVIFERATTTSDGSGGQTRSWSVLRRDRAWIQGRRATEGLQGGGLEGMMVHRVGVRRFSGIRPDMRLLIPRAATVLDASATSTATSLTISSAGEFRGAFPTDAKRPYLVLVGSELIRVTSGHGTTTWTVSRAQDSTSSAAHSDGDGVLEMVPCNIGPAMDMTGLMREMVLDAVEITDDTPGS